MSRVVTVVTTVASVAAITALVLLGQLTAAGAEPVVTTSSVTPTTFSENGLAASDPSPFSTGGIVFFIVFAVIAGGAVILYLRNRGQGSASS